MTRNNPIPKASKSITNGPSGFTSSKSVPMRNGDPTVSVGSTRHIRAGDKILNNLKDSKI